VSQRENLVVDGSRFAFRYGLRLSEATDDPTVSHLARRSKTC